MAKFFGLLSKFVRRGRRLRPPGPGQRDEDRAKKVGLRLGGPDRGVACNTAS